ncbi:MAG: hypothetical protein K2P87_07485 [Lachnospiraceae bacterium]|nr:hypothetical protein [Lachnospiraceae bacterium]
MAAQNNTQKRNPSASGSRKGTGSTGNRRGAGGNGTNRSGAARGTSGGGSGKNGNGSDKWMNIFLVLLVVTVIVLAILYFRKDGDEPENPVPTQQVQPGGVTPGADGVTGSPTDVPDPTGPIEPTDAPTEPPVMTPTDVPDPTREPDPTEAVSPTPKATVPPSEGIDTAEADEILADVFWEVGYRFTLSDSDFVSGGERYYRYDVSYEGKAQSYDVLVRRDDGELYYYENGKKRDFDGLLEHTEQPDKEDTLSDAMTADAAAELLKQFSYTSLGLPAPLDECSLMLDNWKTVVYGEECHCLNVFYNGTLAGNIYFTEDAGKVYYLDEFGEFVAVR